MDTPNLTPTRLVVFTVIEAVALIVFFTFASPWIYTVSTIIVILVMFTGLTIEHIIVLGHYQGYNMEVVSQSIILSAVETVAWINWLVFAHGVVFTFTNVTFALGAIILLLMFQHTFEYNAVKGNNIFDNFFDRSSIGPSILEGLTASMWWVVAFRAEMAIAGAILLFIGLLVEHIVMDYVL